MPQWVKLSISTTTESPPGSVLSTAADPSCLGDPFRLDPKRFQRRLKTTELWRSVVAIRGIDFFRVTAEFGRWQENFKINEEAPLLQLPFLGFPSSETIDIIRGNQSRQLEHCSGCRVPWTPSTFTQTFTTFCRRLKKFGAPPPHHESRDRVPQSSLRGCVTVTAWETFRVSWLRSVNSGRGPARPGLPALAVIVEASRDGT